MVIPESCPACGSTRYKKNGHTRHGKQNHLCKNCERQFSTGTANHLIASERRAEIEKPVTRAHLPARDLPCSGRQPAVAIAPHGGMLCKLPRSFICATLRQSSQRTDVQARG